MKLTQWFPGTVKPVREGVYQREYGPRAVLFCHWNGKFWGTYGTAPKAAKRWAYAVSAHQNLPWRGVEK